MSSWRASNHVQYVALLTTGHKKAIIYCVLPIVFCQALFLVFLLFIFFVL